jgi:hypothetical protein
MRLLFWIALAWLVSPAAARADYGVEIVCSRTANVALVRFGWSEAGSPAQYRALPMRIDGGLSHGRPRRQSECRLPNGWRLRVRDGEEQAHSYGMGGADPPAFFSLWINERRVFSRAEWKPGYSDSFTDKPWLIGLVVRPDSMSRCEAIVDLEIGPIACRNERFRLTAHRVDRVEYPPNGRKWKEGSWFADPVTADRGFCARYLRTMLRPMFGRPAIYSAFQGDDRVPFGAGLVERRLPGHWQPRVGDTETAPGRRVRILRMSDISLDFDGDMIFLLPPGADPLPLLPPADANAGDDYQPKLPPGTIFLAGGRYGIYPEMGQRGVHFLPQRIDGQLYFLASPAIETVQPTALLLGLTSQGSIRRMCVLRRIEPHF